MQAQLEGILQKRKNRVLSKILGSKESIADPHLSEDARAELRKVILDEVNALCEFALDLMEEVGDPGVQINEQALDMLTELHQEVVGGSRRLEVTAHGR